MCFSKLSLSVFAFLAYFAGLTRQLLSDRGVDVVTEGRYADWEVSLTQIKEAGDFCAWPFYCAALDAEQQDRSMDATIQNKTFLDSLKFRINSEGVKYMLLGGGCSTRRATRAFKQLYADDLKYVSFSHELARVYRHLRRMECEPEFIRNFMTSVSDSEVDPGGWGLLFAKSFLEGLHSRPSLAKAVGKLQRSTTSKYIMLGSNTGNEAFYAHFGLGVPRVLGVDINCDLVAAANEVKSELAADGIDFMCSDALDFDYTCQDISIVYIDDDGWDEDVLHRLTTKLDAEVARGTLVISWQAYLSLPHWKELKGFPLDATWTIGLDEAEASAVRVHLWRKETPRAISDLSCGRDEL
ncbi:hypothetical protein CYMTET_11755 [Cymbomonas tetramitiformis]|uniref:Methyltransferase domain-containing protein n=1 Tax=Cymbomonas tetramitiformis TaxID=36881 RepID=A0AAE0GM23_9CHLO|nr:hypothetical protein CYMTET_11755 [Cymbomonas tetramitiformis]